MKRVTVTALRDFQYQNRAIKSGEVFEMTPIHAAIHRRKQHVSLVRRVLTASVQADPEPDARPKPDSKPRRRRNSYRRRDLVAEP